MLKRRMHVGLRPVEDAAQLVPVGHVLEFEQLDRRAGDDEAVELLVPAHPPSRDRRRSCDRPACSSACGSVILTSVSSTCSGVAPTSRANCVSVLILLGIRLSRPIRSGRMSWRGRGRLGHDHDAFALERRAGGQIVGNLDRHGLTRALGARSIACRDEARESPLLVCRSPGYLPSRPCSRNCAAIA